MIVAQKIEQLLIENNKLNNDKISLIERVNILTELLNHPEDIGKYVDEEGNINMPEYENYEDIYSARTFCFKKDIDALLSNGYGKSSNQNNTLILNDDLTPLNSDDNQEFIKHKVLDFIGDMYGSGYRIVGDFYCYKSGHFINNIMLKAILNDKTCYEIVEI